MPDERRRSRSRSRDRDEYGSHAPPGMGSFALSDLPMLPNHSTASGMSSPSSSAGGGFLASNYAMAPSNNSNNNNGNLMAAATKATQDKLARELFVGNTPPGTSEMLLLQFLNGAMRRVGLCQAHETPILNCRVNTKFAFIELVSADMANQALHLNGIPFLGAILKVSRPSKYAGPPYPSKSWQELTGQALPMGAVLDASAEEKVARELFVGNTTPEMTELALRDFLGNAMIQVGLTEAPGNPITACRLSGKFAFIELRSPSEARKALNLNNIPFMGVQLRVGRPSKWNGPPDSNVGNWEDILAKYMSGELQISNGNIHTNFASLTANPTTMAMSPTSPPPAAAAAVPSRVVELKNMLSINDLQNDDEYQDILADTEEECQQFGKLLKVVIPKRDEPGATKIFLEYATTEDAGVAISKLAGRTFDGKKVEAAYYDQDKFHQQQFE